MITVNFIKQCEQAEELQRAWRPKDLDTFCYTKSREIGQACIDNKKRTQKEYDENLKHQFCIFSLEQLFEIAHKAYNKNAHYKSKEYEIIADFIDWMLNSDIDKYKDFNLDFDDTKSCLLIYIMEEFYNKIWNGKDWQISKEE